MTPSIHHEIYLEPNPQNTFLGPIKNSMKFTFVTVFEESNLFVKGLRSHESFLENVTPKQQFWTI